LSRAQGYCASNRRQGCVRVIFQLLIANFYSYFSDISAHWRGAFEIFPAASFPKLAAARIVLRHQNIYPLETGAFQTGETFIDQSPSDSVAMIRWIDSQMINVAAPTIVTAQVCADHERSNKCDPTQSAISFQEPPNVFAIVAFGKIETFDPFPQFNRRIVIVDSKLARLDVDLAGHAAQI
jgi:hypothetical protein